jgi:hypothetical protein
LLIKLISCFLSGTPLLVDIVLLRSIDETFRELAFLNGDIRFVEVVNSIMFLFIITKGLGLNPPSLVCEISQFWAIFLLNINFFAFSMTIAKQVFEGIKLDGVSSPPMILLVGNDSVNRLYEQWYDGMNELCSGEGI